MPNVSRYPESDGRKSRDELHMPRFRCILLDEENDEGSQHEAHRENHDNSKDHTHSHLIPNGQNPMTIQFGS